jgi:tetratricopeptide (TPR) repeat protein
MHETADRTETLFAAAVALAPADRGVYLERECAGDPALRDRLLALLKAHDRAGHVIDRPVNCDADQTAGYARTSEQPGTVIAGRYKLLEEIGEGGMGTVWAAEQTTPVRRKVALKLIKAGMDSRSVLARFEAERQALAVMDHPNIAKVLDGGLTESGRPFFVMDYVKGVPITEYCDATRLSVEERLNLFVQVCSALQHAHQKGIIHRDLKPSNILVAPYDDKPVPKVIDFGLAKAMHHSLTEKTLYTAHGTVLGTPLYMSPEQAQLNNLDVDTRSDIYSLGVLLYELLTGTTPIERKRFTEAAWDEIRRMIREEEPPRPSIRLSSTDTLPSLAIFRHTEPATLKKLVRGEIDWIVMKALEKDRTRRYETASGFARDIQRYLDDEVVEARPPSAGYRIGKFIRRHKAQVIAASLVLVALLAGMAGTTWGLFREARANTRLSESLDREQKANAGLATANAKVQARYDLAVDAVKTFHTGVSEDFLLKEEKFKDLRNRLLKSASDFYGKLSALLGEESDFDSRRALALANFELAELTDKVGQKQDALTMHQAVLAAREALAAEPGAGVRERVELGRSLTGVAELLEWTGKPDESLAVYRRAEGMLAGQAASDVPARAALATCRRKMAIRLRYAGKMTESLLALRQARADQEALAAVPGATRDAHRDLGETLNEIGYVLWNMNRPSEAEVELRASRRVWQELADAHPDVAEFHRGLAASRFYRGNVLRLIAKPTEAEAEVRASVAIHQRMANETPAVWRIRRSLGVSRLYLGNLLTVAGKPAEAEVEYRAAVSIFRELVGDNPAVGELLSELAAACGQLSSLLSQTDRPVEADAESREALSVSRQLAEGPAGTNIFRLRFVGCLMLRGDVVRKQGRAAEARSLYEDAIAGLNAADEPDLLIRADASWRLGLTLGSVGDFAGAATVVRQAVRLYDERPQTPGLELDHACCYASLAGLAGRAGSGVSASEAQEAAARAMEWLGRAVANGFRDTNQIRIESAFDPLRTRDVFKKLMAELEKNTPGQQQKK